MALTPRKPVEEALVKLYNEMSDDPNRTKYSQHRIPRSRYTMDYVVIAVRDGLAIPQNGSKYGMYWCDGQGHPIKLDSVADWKLAAELADGQVMHVYVRPAEHGGRVIPEFQCNPVSGRKSFMVQFVSGGRNVLYSVLATTTYDRLRKSVLDRFPHWATAEEKVLIMWEDAEKKLVVLGCQADLTAALRTMSGDVLKLPGDSPPLTKFRAAVRIQNLCTRFGCTCICLSKLNW